MEFMTDPAGIEARSMEIIAPHLTGLQLSPAEVKVYSRMIHASGDPEYAPIIRIHPEAIKAGCQALSAGCNIYCDVEMVRTGINKNRLAEYGGTVQCLIADPEIAAIAQNNGITRSMAAMRQFAGQLDGAIVAIGNAPTALFEVLDIINRTNIRPALIIGVPVGFVGAAESKALLHETAPVPYITVLGNKGGSPIAAATTNALVYMLEK
ncbi:precorrin-8X methylmutase|uniref:Precorrin-8X methylmutase n=1 Tax=Dendrosporobacter quercicolus TaxID=146817 RepID=A0A1G9LII4_9FIRM|nr:precorrin-8X methylmutase [Dendrosporobacter quercicolus]NSL46723.1 precorrin-8X methylmutase [Dendrosporobacter quercicolus DSM 1736]SDL61721.1 precorrin-8X methylmutase [Dendrosporobacter quercicolus]